MMVLCPHCGAEVSDKDKYCPYCNHAYDPKGLTPAKSATDKKLADGYKRPEPKPMTPARQNFSFALAITMLISTLGLIISPFVAWFSKNTNVSIVSGIIGIACAIITVIGIVIAMKYDL